MSTIGQRISRKTKKEVRDSVAETNYGGGAILAPLQFKAEDDEAETEFLGAIEFEGFANVGGPDLGGDIVEPSAFTRATIAEYLKFGRQLFFMHDRYSQVGEITAAEKVLAGTRSKFGIKEGGLLVKGFVDSPLDDEGMIPDHPLAKIIHFARMQAKKGRLKLLSIGWRPVKTELVKRPDPRRGNEEATFRLIKSLILGEISLVTMAMAPQSMIELSKAYRGAYGDEIAGALFAEEFDETDLARIPENVEGLTIERLREMVTAADALALAAKVQPEEGIDAIDEEGAGGEAEKDYEIVSLRDLSETDYEIISLRGE